MYLLSKVGWAAFKFFPSSSRKYIASFFLLDIVLQPNSKHRSLNKHLAKKNPIPLTLLLSISVKVSPPLQTCVSVEWRNRRSAVQLWYQRCESCPEIGEIGEWGMFWKARKVANQWIDAGRLDTKRSKKPKCREYNPDLGPWEGVYLGGGYSLIWAI